MADRSDEKICPTKILSKKACIFRLFYWTKVTKILSDIGHCFIRLGIIQRDVF